VSVACAVAVAGCTGSSSSPEPGSTSASPSTAVTTPPPSPAAQLRALARESADGVYRATYVARQKHPKSRATWMVWRGRESLRVDVITRSSKSTLIVTPKAAFACQAAKHDKTCFRVAKNGDRISPLFRLLAAKLFATDLRRLAAHGEDYTVKLTEPFGAPGARSASCFAVRATKKAPDSHVAGGTYCFSEDGVLTVVSYPSGNTVRLQKVRTKLPEHKVFKPYAHPTPIQH